MQSREPTPEEREGMHWWNSISESERRYWLDRAGSARPVDAWRMYAREVIFPMKFSGLLDQGYTYLDDDLEP